MGLIKRVYTDQETVITAKNLNDIQDAVISLEDSIVTIDNARSGEDIVITDAAKTGLKGLRIFGKTTQNGTPTPDAPVPLVSVGDSGSITVHIASEEDVQTMDIATPNGLPGIPVADGGNYTDANGQQWICDEIDFARGVRINRIQEVSKFSPIVTSNTYSVYQETCDNEMIGQEAYLAALCTHTSIYKYNANDTTHFYIDGKVVRVYLQAGTDVTGLKVYAILKDPIEIDLSEEELAAYAALHTYKGYNNISNSENAYMALEYVMDAKKYIDSMITAGILEATVE